MGNNHDYKFPRKYTSQLEHFVQSPYSGKITYIEASGRIYNKKELVDSYGFKYLKKIDKGSALWNKAGLSPELAKKPVL